MSISIIGWSQPDFSEIENTPFVGTGLGSLTWSDVDRDGDLDVLITGEDEEAQKYSNLYLNSNGLFSLVTGDPFEGVGIGSSCAFADIDNDGDEDVLITGLNNSGQRTAKLYENSGGSFTEIAGTPFDGVNASDIAWSDVDNDGDQDVLITGQQASSTFIAKLYENVDGNFSEVVGTPFTGVYHSAIAWADVDNDGDEDLLITGDDGIGQKISKLYINASGIFTEAAGTPFEGVRDGAVAWSDVEGNGTLDVLISGDDNTNKPSTILYRNTGSSFVKIGDAPFPGLASSAVAWSDMDNDGKYDVLISGYDLDGFHIVKLFQNTGNSSISFTEVSGTPFEGVRSGSIAWADIDSDGDEDVLISGVPFAADYITKLYRNDLVKPQVSFREVTDAGLVQVENGATGWSDIDKDGDKDLMIIGNSGSGRTSKLYRNLGTFEEITGTSFEPLSAPSVTWSDVDNDGDKDVLITGLAISNNPVSKLYLNSFGTFTEDTGVPFHGVAAGGGGAWADYDNDGDEDVVIFGYENPFVSGTTLYENDAGTFTKVTGTPFEYVYTFASVLWTDYDMDGDEDLFVCGDGIAKLYKNESGIFTEVSGTPFTGVNYGDVALSDIDNDGDEDILITGDEGTLGYFTELYRNDNGVFSLVPGSQLDPMSFSEAEFSDFDNDGDEDLLINGITSLEPFGPITRLYQNDGGNFTEVLGTPFERVRSGSISWIDYDKDGDKDVLITGKNENDEGVTKLYENVQSDPDLIAPQIEELIPAVGSKDIVINTNLLLEFDEDVVAGTGNVTIIASNGDVEVEVIDITSNKVTIDSEVVLIDPEKNLEENTNYYINVDATAILDESGNFYVGISDKTTWNFTVGDFTAPGLVSFTPEDNALGVATDVDLVMQFSENIAAGTGNISISKAIDNSLFEAIAITSDQVTIINNQVTVTLSDEFEESTEYYIEIDDGAIVDLSGKSFQGIEGFMQWNFTIGDFVIPEILTLDPADDATDVDTEVVLTITFNESVDVGTGSISIFKSIDDSLVEAIDVTGTQVADNGDNFNIDPSVIMDEDTEFYVQIPSSVFVDDGGNEFGGILDKTSWSFTTVKGNSAPTVENSIPDQQLEQGFAQFDIDLTDVFDDEDGDILIYTLTSSNPEVVTVQAPDVILTIFEQGVGISTISVTANDGNNGEASLSFDVEVLAVTGIWDEETGGIRLYPNPATDHVFINAIQPYNKYEKITMTDLAGHLIPVKFTKTGDQFEADLKNLNKGLYLIRIYIDDRIIVRSILIN